MKLSDFKGLFKKEVLEILEIENPYEDYFTVKLSIPQGMTWKPGEHGIFTIPGHKIEGKKFRAFSVASTAEEGYLMIGTNTGKSTSSYKKVLLNLKKGDSVNIRGPFGWFKLPVKSAPLVMIAGGVGITPIRALLAGIKDKEQKVDIVYSSHDFYLFEEEIANFSVNKNINLNKTANKEDTIEIIKTLADKLRNGAYYYISGSPGFIKSVKRNLKSRGIKGKRIVYDPFVGY